MGARYRPEEGDEHPESATGGDTVGQQGESHVPAGKALAHDPGSDNDRKQEGRTHRFGGEAARKRHCLPISLTVFSSLRRSSFSSGRLVKSSMRRLSMLATRANSRFFASSLPSKAAGSSTPQWAVIG